MVSLAIFWACWGMFWVMAETASALAGIVVVVGFGAGLSFFLTLYKVWEPESGESPIRMMFVPSFRRSRMRVQRHLFDLLRPSWIRRTLRATDWPPEWVGVGLLALVVADLVLFFSSLPRLARQ